MAPLLQTLGAGQSAENGRGAAAQHEAAAWHEAREMKMSVDAGRRLTCAAVLALVLGGRGREEDVLQLWPRARL